MRAAVPKRMSERFPRASAGLVESPCALVRAAKRCGGSRADHERAEGEAHRIRALLPVAIRQGSAPRYVELIWSDAATFGGVTSDGPDSTRPEGSQDYLVYRRSVAGVGSRAFFVNLNGLEYTLWVLDGRRAVAVQAVLGPEDLDKYKALAGAQLAAWH